MSLPPQGQSATPSCYDLKFDAPILMFWPSI
uniref:Uncharacterized protein n=1 Tax=Arundo donax TaxID=35708 RepID=A0A0A8XUC9_ARUDO